MRRKQREGLNATDRELFAAIEDLEALRARADRHDMAIPSNSADFPAWLAEHDRLLRAIMSAHDRRYAALRAWFLARRRGQK